MRKQLLLVTSLILTIILTAVTVVFAWFTVVEKTQPIFIYSGSVKAVATLNETNLVNEEITLSYAFDNVVPGDNYVFELVLTNEGTLDVEVTATIKFETNDIQILPYFEISYGTFSETLNNIPPRGHSFNFTNTLISGQNSDTTFNSKTLIFNINVLNTLTKDDITQNNIYLKITSIEITLTQAGGN